MTGPMPQIFTHLIWCRQTGNCIPVLSFLYGPWRMDLHSPSILGQERLNIKDYCLWVIRSSSPQLQVRRRRFTISNLVKILPVLVESRFIEDIGEQSDPGPLPKARLIKQSCNFPQFHKHSTLAVSAFLVIGWTRSLPKGEKRSEAGEAPQWQRWVPSSIPGDKCDKERGVKLKVRHQEVVMQTTSSLERANVSDKRVTS